MGTLAQEADFELAVYSPAAVSFCGGIGCLNFGLWLGEAYRALHAELLVGMNLCRL